MPSPADTAYRSLKSLTKREAAYLWQLNHQLHQAEAWILNRFQQGLATSHRLRNHHTNPEAALDVRVRCLRRQDQPGLGRATESIVADLDANFLLMRNTMEALQIRWRSQAEHEAHFLAAMPTCLLFQRLALEVCRGNMAPLLTIDKVRTEIVLRHEGRLGD